MRILRLLSLLAALFVSSSAFAAGDWTVVKLRGDVQQLIEQSWTPLARGDVVPDDRTVRTMADGHVDLQRGEEVVTLGANTQIQIHDKTDVQYTTVQEDHGSVEVEAKIENVKHFEVATKFLAAVVKGTHFIVNANDLGASVTVTRGFVAVQSAATQRSTTVTVGQTVLVASSGDMSLGGTGPLPAVFNPDGGVFRASVPDSAPVPVLPGAPAQAAAAIAPSADGVTPVVTTAALVNPADMAAVTQLRGSIGGDNGPAPTPASGAAAAPAKEDPPNLLTIAIGLLIGIVIGAVALAFRRAVG